MDTASVTPPAGSRARRPLTGVPFSKGHGTGNDFVVLPDPLGGLDLSAGVVARICDRRRGVGADGVLRVVRAAVLPEFAAQVDATPDAVWAMDYRNADGSVAEMCGNGARVCGRFLVAHGWAEPGTIALVTRGGVRAVTVPVDATAPITVDMGPPHLTHAVRSVRAVGDDGTLGPERSGTEVWMGNPHVVVSVADLTDAGPLHRAPQVAPALDTNVEFVVRLGLDHLALRVHERGSGETQSCGTGACAAAVADATATGRMPAADAPLVTTVDVPGGRLTVTWTVDTVLLTGPADLVASGVLDPGLWDAE